MRRRFINRVKKMPDEYRSTVKRLYSLSDDSENIPVKEIKPKRKPRKFKKYDD
jgi:hypothetical protein